MAIVFGAAGGADDALTWVRARTSRAPVERLRGRCREPDRRDGGSV